MQQKTLFGGVLPAHSIAQPFACRHCNRSFARRAALVLHEKSHTAPPFGMAGAPPIGVSVATGVVSICTDDLAAAGASAGLLELPEQPQEDHEQARAYPSCMYFYTKGCWEGGMFYWHVP